MRYKMFEGRMEIMILVRLFDGRNIPIFMEFWWVGLTLGIDGMDQPKLKY